MRTVVPHGARLIPPEAKKVFEGVIYDVYHWPQQMFDGRTATFEMLKRKDSIKVLAIKDDKLIFLQDEQPTLGTSTALPGGRHDVEGETELECAKRELREETGFIFKTWKLIGVHQPSIEVEWFVYLFLASDFVRQEESHNDGGERITVQELTLSDAQKIAPSYASLAYALDFVNRADSVSDLLVLPEYH
jgi:ADP-ribose diphosphatase